MAWFVDISEKFDNFCSDVDAVNCQESIKFVGNQLLAVGSHVKEFCSEIIQDVQGLPPVSEEEVLDFSELNFVDPVKDSDSDLSFEQNAVIVTCEKSNAGNKESCVDEGQTGEDVKPPNIEVSRDLQASSSVVSTESCESEGQASKNVEATNIEVSSDLQASSSVVSTESCESEGQASKNVEATNIEVSSDLQASSSVESRECEVSDSGVSCSDLSSASAVSIDKVTTESYGSESELSNDSVESEEIEHLSNSGSSDVSSSMEEVMDLEDACAEKLIVNNLVECTRTESIMDHHVTEEGLETAQSKLTKLEQDESFTLIDGNEISSICDLEKIARAPEKKFVEMKAFEWEISFSSELDTEQSQPGKESLTLFLPTEKVVLSDEELCGSDWVVL